MMLRFSEQIMLKIVLATVVITLSLPRVLLADTPARFIASPEKPESLSERPVTENGSKAAQIKLLKQRLAELRQLKLELAERLWKVKIGINDKPVIGYGTDKTSPFDGTRRHLVQQLLSEFIVKINKNILETESELEGLKRRTAQIGTGRDSTASSPQ